VPTLLAEAALPKTAAAPVWAKPVLPSLPSLAPMALALPPLVMLTVPVAAAGPPGISA